MKNILCLLGLSFCFDCHFAWAQPRASDQWPNLSQLPDQSQILQEKIDSEGGNLTLDPGVYRITQTLQFSLQQTNSAWVKPSSGHVTIIMDGPGPAIRIQGSHQGTASPKSFTPETWNERSPQIEDIEIVGNHPQADGIELIQTVQPIINSVSIRWCRHALHLTNRNRNLTISDCHFYENQGIGIYFDDVNIHQANISNCHISYNREGGIVIREGNVRNVQIGNCDIEANMPADDSPTQTANILLDCSSSKDDKTRSIAEIAITGCTIQHSSNYSGANYESLAPGGSNIRLIGKKIWPIDSVTITGNVISDTSLNVELIECTDVTLGGNTFFAPNPDNLRVSRCKRVVVTGNTFNPRQFQRPGRIIFSESNDCIVSNCTFRRLEAEDGTIQIRNCHRINLNGNILTESQSGVVVENSSDINFAHWIVSGLPDTKKEALQKIGDCVRVKWE